MSSSSTKKTTVEDASSSPTPPPAVDLPENPTEDDKIIDQPIDSLGEDEDDAAPEDKEGDEEEEEEWDPSEERLPGQSTSKEKGKDKDKAEDGEQGKEGQEQPWQAVWSAEQNAWYFWNTKTSEVSWTNPLGPPSSSSQPPLPTTSHPSTSQPSFSSSSTSTHPQPNAWETPSDPSQPEIDPGLAHLFGGDSMGSMGDQGVQKATFNSRTGKFTPLNYEYTVGHLDEYNRSKRMNNHYFDVDQWEKQKAEENQKRKRDEEEGKGGDRKLTKKDMERFRKKNAERKARSQAWLRE